MELVRTMQAIYVARDESHDSEPAEAIAIDLAARNRALVTTVGIRRGVGDEPCDHGQALAVGLLGRSEPPEVVLADVLVERPDLVVTSARGIARIRDRMLGSVARSLALGAPCPVVFARKSHDLGSGPVLILTDYEPPQPAEFEFSRTIASLLGVEAATAGFSVSQAVRAAGTVHPGLIVVAHRRLRGIDSLAAQVDCPVAVVPGSRSG